MAREILHVLREHDTEPTELAAALVSLAFGIWLLLPMPTFATTPTWAVLSSIASEGAWGALSVGLGALTLWGVADRELFARRLGLFLEAVYWGAIAGATYVAHPFGAAPIAYGAFLVASGWAYLRVTHLRSKGPG